MTIDCPCGYSYAVAASDTVMIAWCPYCGTGATVPPPERDVYGDGLFEDADAGYGGKRLQAREQWFHEARLRLDWMAKRLNPGAQLLEVGAATGEFVAVADQRGYAVTGLETSAAAADAAAEVTGNVRNEDLAAWRKAEPGQLVDAVAMFHVLEHFPVPGDFLKELVTVLRPGGLLFLEVPNGGSRAARADGARWWAARTEDHFFHFTPAGLKTALTSAGYEPIEVRPVHRDIYIDVSFKTRMRIAAKDVIRPLVGKGARSMDLLRAAARRSA
jgi:SAM-dependent methyltransferase